MANRIPKDLMPLIGKMTNWQRNQWARNGYPIDRRIVELYLNLAHGVRRVYRPQQRLRT